MPIRSRHQSPEPAQRRPRAGRMPLMAGNWKMNLNHLEAIALVQKIAFTLHDEEYDEVEVVVLPPFTDLRSVQTMVDGDALPIRYGGQDVSAHGSGAHTGEISAGMLAKLGCSYVLVGHSERRAQHAETDELVNAKLRAALDASLTPILCVGEGLDVRRSGTHLPHCLDQLSGGLAGVPAESARSVVVAYEPVWAIGTGETATPQDAQEVCGALRTRLAELYSGDLADGVRVLYGGSVKGDNIGALMAEPDIDGALVGGASLTAEAFVPIIRFAPATG